MFAPSNDLMQVELQLNGKQGIIKLTTCLITCIYMQTYLDENMVYKTSEFSIAESDRMVRICLLDSTCALCQHH